MKKLYFVLCGILVSIIMFGQNAISIDNPKYPIHVTENTKEYVVNSLEYLVLGDFSDGHVVVIERNTDEAYIFDQVGNKTGSLSLVWSPGDRMFPQFCEGVASGKLPDESTVLFSTSGEIKKNFRDYLKGRDMFMQTPQGFTDGLALIAEKRAVFQFVNTKGEVVFPNLHMMLPDMGDFSVRPLISGRRFYCSYPDRLFGIIDEKGNIIVEPKFSSVSDFSEGLAAVSVLKGNQEIWGFIDTTGEFVIEPVFNVRPGDFHFGYSVARKKNGNYVYVDTKGTVCSEEYVVANRFIDGKAIVSKTYAGVQVIDTSFQTLKEYRGSLRASRFSDEYSLIWDSADRRLYSPDGTLMYCNAGLFHEGLAYYSTYNTISQRGEKGYINRQGEVIIRFVENQF